MVTLSVVDNRPAKNSVTFHVGGGAEAYGYSLFIVGEQTSFTKVNPLDGNGNAVLEYVLAANSPLGVSLAENDGQPLQVFARNGSLDSNQVTVAQS